MKLFINKALFLLGLFSLVSILLFFQKNASSFPCTGKSINGLASWYSDKDPGIKKTTANMEHFDDRLYTCAMWGIPFNTMVKVTNQENGRSVIVRVNDRGPAKKLVKKGRVIDLTRSAFSRISPLNQGIIKVDLEIISD